MGKAFIPSPDISSLINETGNKLEADGQQALPLSNTPLPQAPSSWDNYLGQRDKELHPTDMSHLNSEGYGALWRQSSFSHGMMADYKGTQFEPQQDYAAYGDPKEWADLTKGIPDDMHKYFYSSMSPAQSQSIKARLNEKLADEAMIGRIAPKDQPWGTLFQLANPELILAAVASGGIADLAIAARVGRTLKAASAFEGGAGVLRTGEVLAGEEAGATGTSLVAQTATRASEPLAIGETVNTGHAMTPFMRTVEGGAEPLAIESGSVIEGEFSHIPEAIAPARLGSETMAEAVAPTASVADVAGGVAKTTTGRLENTLALGATFAGHEKLRQSYNFEDDNWKVLDAGLMAMAMGAPFSGMRYAGQQALARAASLERDVLHIQKIMHDNPNAPITAEAQATLNRHAGLIDELVAQQQGHHDGSIGAAQASPLEDPHSPTFMNKGRIGIVKDAYAHMNQQSNRTLRELAHDFIKDPIGNSKKVAQAMTASELKKLYIRTISGDFHTNAMDNFLKMSKDMGWSRFNRSKQMDKFFSDITRLTRNDTSVLSEYPAPVQQYLKNAAEAQRKVYSRMLEKAKAAGVKGADETNFDDFYANRSWKQSKIVELVKQHGQDEVFAFLSRAAKVKGTGTFTPEAAKSFVQTVMKLEYSHQLQELPLGVKDTVQLRRELADMKDSNGNPTLSQGDIDNFVDHIMESKPTGADAGTASNMKFRLPVDENYSEALATGKIKVSDFFENDSRLLVDRYMNTMAGHTARAEKGITSNAAFAERMAEADAEHQENAFTRDGKEYETNRRMMEDMNNHIVGKPMSMNKFGVTDRILNAYRGVARMSMLGELGALSTFEYFNSIGLFTHEAMLKQMPSFKTFIEHLKGDNVPTTEMQKNVRAIWGFGNERRMAYSRQHEVTDHTYDPYLSKFENKINDGSHFMDALSGNSGATSYTREATAAMRVQQLVDFANDPKKLTASARERLVHSGINDHDIDAVLADLKKYTDRDGEVVKGINHEQWTQDDPHTFHAFETAVDRGVREGIQDHDIGEVPWWTHSTEGKVMGELRNFTLGSHTKQFLKSMHYRDATSFNQWMYGYAGAAMSYAMQVSVNYAGNPDEIAKRLAPATFNKAIIMRMGVLGFLPTAMESSYQLMTGGQSLLGKDTANTGNRNFMLTPSMSLAQKQYGAIGTLGKALSPFASNEPSAHEVKSALGSIPFSNTYGARNLVEMLSNQFPAK